MADSDWKKRVGVDVNYSPGQSSDEDELDSSSETKKWKALDSISAEYDHLATTPPRTRIRNKEKQKYYGDDGSHVISPRFHRVVRRNTTENIVLNEPNPSQESFAVKRTKRRSLKYTRGYERDLKLDIDRCRESRNESMPTTYQVFDFLKEVESSNRFKSLYSQPVNYISESKNASESNSEVSSSDRVLDNRAEFHSYFCLSIRMGNSEKKQKSGAKEQTCKRTVQAEKQVWKNQLKDLIWLEVTAHKAGRTDTQQDAYLLSHRESVPSLLDKILDFRFINTEKKCSHSGVWTTQISVSSPDSGYVNFEETGTFNEPAPYEECLCVDCSVCSMTVGRAMLEVKQLLDALSEAESLFSSTREMAIHHPVINTDEFTNKTKAMCLWYNMVHHQRLKILIIKKLLYKHRWKTSTNKKENEIKTQYENDKTTRDSSKLHQVKFHLENDNEKSEITTNDDNETDDLNQTQIQIEITETHANDLNSKNYDTVDSGHESIKSFDTKIDSHAEKSCLNVKSTNGMKEENTTIIEENFQNSELSKSPYESADSTTGSTNSNESGIAPSVIENQEDGTNIYDREEFNVFNMGPLGDLTKLRLYNPKLISPYRDYIEKMLKVRGLRRALYFLEKLHLCVLKKAKMTLEKYDEEILNEDIQLRNEENLDSSDDDFEYERHTRCEVDIQELKRECIELRRFGAWSKETLDMHLPSYRSAFLFLSTVPMENIHEFLTMRLEAKPEKPSALSIKQCIHELREGLAIAVRLRGRFTTHIYTALFAEPEDSKHRKFYDKVLSTFDTTLNEFYKLYLSYLSDWSGMEHLPRATLTAEWTFNSYLAQRLRPAATIAPLTFCCLTVRQLEGAANRLKNRVKELREKAESIKKGDESNSSIKLRILGVCRDLQCLLSEEREKALSTAQFARTVSKNLHHNSVFRDYRQKIYKAMASVQSVLCWTIDQMQQATAPERLLELEESDRPSVQSRTREIVSQGYKFGFAFHREMCRLINDDISPEGGHNSCTRNSLSMCRQSRLVRTDSINYDNIQASMEDNYFSFNAFTPTSNNEFIYSTENPKSYNRLKSKDEEALSLSLYGRKDFRKRQNSSTRSRRSPKFTPFDDIKELSELKPEDFQNGIPGCETCCRVPMYNETENSSVKRTFGEKNSTCDWELMVSRGLVQFAKQWMEFALKRCERGRGLRPRWASHGLEFLMLTCDPQHTKHLTDREFKELKSMMDGCISHVIGSSQGANNNAMTPTIGTPPPQRARTSPLYNQQLSSIILPSTPPSTPLIELGTDSHNFSEDAESAVQHKRLKALKELDSRRDEDLHRSGVIGYVRQETGARHHFRPRPVTFKWQRGIKIGQGRFGKVYTVVNTESGQLMAMKEVSLSVGDRQSVDRAANELKVLEGVVHPNLVQYYGVEIHREEMLIFMELCVEGSLESMIAGCSNTADGVNTNGLPEQLIRRYTGQLVSAIRALHDRSIAHRDVKSGNIFLTEGGNCLKLGDFGCAVKIRANTTVPGELQGYVGTQAYMAPEVFMKPSGHGRAADIWSLGCVVVEMASGKHPWSDCDSNYQIMFVVGMGNIPKIPSSLSAEGEDFCLACLQHDPTVRASAEKLEHHHFLKVNRNEYY